MQGCSPTVERSSSPIDMIGAGSPLSQGNSPLHSPSASAGGHPQPGPGSGMGLMDGSGNYSAGLENYTGHTELSKEFSKFSMVSVGRRRTNGFLHYKLQTVAKFFSLNHERRRFSLTGLHV